MCSSCFCDVPLGPGLLNHPLPPPQLSRLAGIKAQILLRGWGLLSTVPAKPAWKSSHSQRFSCTEAAQTRET